MNPIIKAVGGKSRIANKFILPKIAPHQLWVDCTYFGGSTTIKKPTSDVEICGDLNYDIIRLNKIIQSDPYTLANFITQINYDEKSFDWASDYKSELDDILFAGKYLIRNRMSRDGMMQYFVDSQRHRGGQPENRNVWAKLPTNIIKYYNRIQRCVFIHTSAANLINTYKQLPNCVIYIDLPYLIGERVSKNLYQVEANEKVHIDTLDAAQGAIAQIIFSHFNHPLYNTKLAQWKRYELPVKLNIGTKKVKGGRIECLWVNR